MPRHIREVIPGLPHHITTRANNRRRLFSYATDYRCFIQLLARALGESGCALHQLTLMANYVHLIITPQTKHGMALLIKHTCQSYAQRRNLKRKASGKLFEERYLSRPLETTEQVAAATLYADTNALRTGIVDVPTAHRWSTCAIHAGLPADSAIPQRIWTPSAWFDSIGGTDIERVRRYRELLADDRGLAAAAQWMPAEVAAVEKLLSARYSKRLERPDRTRACEAQPPFRVSAAPRKSAR